MADPTGESQSEALRLDFDRRLLLRFRGSTITSDAGLPAYRNLDNALNLTDTAAETLADARTGKNGRHRLAGLLRRSVFERLVGYEGVNDAERLCRDPAMRWVVGDRAITGYAASASQMGRFETNWFCRSENLALADLPGQWIDKVHHRQPPVLIALCSRQRPFTVAQCLQKRDPGSETGGIWRMLGKFCRRGRGTIATAERHAAESCRYLR